MRKRTSNCRRARGLSFDAVVSAIKAGRLIADIPHPNVARFAHQRILVVEIDGYVCAAPYVTDGRKRFLKTIYRSRVLKRFYSSEKKP